MAENQPSIPLKEGVEELSRDLPTCHSCESTAENPTGAGTPPGCAALLSALVSEKGQPSIPSAAWQGNRPCWKGFERGPPRPPSNENEGGVAPDS